VNRINHNDIREVLGHKRLSYEEEQEYIRNVDLRCNYPHVKHDILEAYKEITDYQRQQGDWKQLAT